MADVVLVDPHRLIRAGISLILHAQPDFQVIGETDCGENAIELVRTLNPDVLCIAARMEGVDGLEVTRRVRAMSDIRQPRILLLVGSKDGDVSHEGEAVGADAVVAKYATPESIVMAFRAALVSN
ncbi:response regulator [Gulosibacter molinativorax]|uniref:DNA-binding response regulator n=1 Tax=Gulosibacter molinativorax TaxID=256821 RepID=A0ABT7C832_9MICO|nr:response regulator [Gulosibacter molinativorax]MDJ1371365.1 DNA-binding response regulator [Gulosibacter molinativorax]QUY62862.1 Hypotetical protein [Gulosibacter molinativorax]